MMTPAQVAKRANVSVGSIRNWSKDYANLLSPTGRGETGARLFTDEDVQVLCAIAALRKSGVPPDEVAARVRDGQAPSVVDVSPQEALQSPQTAQDAPLALQIGYNALQGQINALARRVETQQRGAMLWTLGMGIWIGMVTMGLIFFAVWLVVNGGL